MYYKHKVMPVQDTEIRNELKLALAFITSQLPTSAHAVILLYKTSSYLQYNINIRCHRNMLQPF